MLILTIFLIIDFFAKCSSFLDIRSYRHFARDIKNVHNIEDVSLSTACRNDISKYATDLLSGETWALELFDASSKFPSGILKGHGTDLGSFDECLGVTHKFNISEKIVGKYCITTIPLNLTSERLILDVVKADINPDSTKGFHMAICFPHTCSAKEMREILSSIGINISLYEQLCQTEGTQPRFNSTAFIAVGFFATILIIMMLCTAYEIVQYYLRKEAPIPLLTAFSVLRNGRSLLSQSGNPNQITCLHGIRWQNSAQNMYMVNGTIAVDTFLLLGGLLVSYNYLIGLKNGAKFNILLHYLHRYLRLTPPLIALIVFYIALLKHVGSGPLWPRFIENDLVVGCEDYWWKSILYIQNYGKQNNMCLPHSWYLCVDMQLFILSPILLIPLKRWPKIIVAFTLLLIACSVVTGFIIGWIYELNIIQGANETLEKVSQYVRYYYFSTPPRAAPWLIGFILGYIIFKYKDKAVIISKVHVIMLWLLCIATMCACLFAGNNLIVDYEKVGSSLHIGIVKPVWAMAISWIIFASVKGYGGPVNWFLSLAFFEVLSKLTYALYLVHFAVIYVMSAQMRETTTFSNLKAMHGFWGDCIFTLAASIVLTLAFDLPIIIIDKRFLRR